MRSNAVAALFGALTFANIANASEDTIVVRWNDITLQAIRDTHPGPPIAARMLAIVDTCMYDAWTAYDPRAAPTRRSPIPKRRNERALDAEKAKSISYAASRALTDLFPSNATLASDMMISLGYDPNDASTDTATSSGIGNTACQAVLDYRHHDGSNQRGELNHGAPYSDYTGYAPVNTPDDVDDPNRWQPLRVPNAAGGSVVQTYVTPFWGQVTPFNPDLRVPQIEGPDKYPSRSYEDGVDLIIRYSAQLDDRQKTIAEYWADGPNSELPPGHWSLFAKFISERDNHTIDQDIKLFFAQANAILDASIAAWAIKRQHDSVRPISAVHYLKSGQPVLAWSGPFKGTQWIDGAAWQPYQAATVVTPPFPEYPSGHSIFSAAGAEILRLFTGSDRFGASFTQLAGSSRVEPGQTPAKDITLTWRTFTAAANEAGLSRRYGGIHFIPGDLDGREAGRQLGASDWQVAKEYFEGHPGPDRAQGD